MAKKVALTLLDLLLMLFFAILGIHEFLSIQLGTSPQLPNAGQLFGFDLVKVLVLGFCATAVVYLVKRIRMRVGR
jgi:hypothetical protein